MFFSDVTHFPEIEDGRIEILTFLDACRGIVRFIELLGTVFSPVKNDILGNIEKLNTIRMGNKEKFLTLNDIVEYELENSKENVGIDALLWLKRALEYMNVFLTCLVNDSKENICTDNLVPYFNKAYEEKLKPYHGWLVQKLFGIMVHAAPSRKSLLQLLAGEIEFAVEDEILADIENFIQGLGSNLEVINSIYKRYDIDSNAKV
ncbi:glycolipid transfer protein-like [Uloborus diversus]|uniref:glycolipid transfer protein-like n=1 Tax=Uloborus diversus TaxID=327109 RepID=UPI00240A1098|nr:glycolipid transfer protein-like [Uloborus diversus]